MDAMQINLEATGEMALGEQAYRKLRRALVEGVFAPGDRLSIRRVAAALGTSAMPARTALRRLAAEQALDLMPSGMAIVPRLTRAAFAELSAIRAELEPLAAQMAASLLSGAALDAMEALNAAYRRARAAGDPAALLQADRQFLFALYAGSGAPMLQGMIEALWLRRGPVFWEARWMLLGQGGVRDRHDEILAALRRREGDAAAAALRDEIRTATAFLLDHLRFADDAPDSAGLAALSPI